MCSGRVVRRGLCRVERHSKNKRGAVFPRDSSNGAMLHRENFPVISRADQVLSIREDSSGSSSSHGTKRGIHKEVEKRVGLWNRE